MRVSYCSDLHLEFSDLTLPGGDVLILAGDVCEAKNVKKENYDPNMVSSERKHTNGQLDHYYRFLEEECSKKYEQVIYVFGNHEMYGSIYHKTFEHIRPQLPDNVHLLDNETYEIGGVIFLGATLWTDMNNMDGWTMYHVKSMMNDYRQITMFDEKKHVYHKLTPEYTVEQHNKTKQYFAQVLSENRQSGSAKPVVVVTHHSPSTLSTHPRYADNTIMNGAYSTDLSEFILDNPEIIGWHHGHTHHTFKYQIGDTWIMCNPRGYKGYEQQAEDFKPQGYDIVDGKIINDPIWE